MTTYSLVLNAVKRTRHHAFGTFGAEKIFKEENPKSVLFKHVVNECAIKLLVSTLKTVAIIFGSSGAFSCYPAYSFMFKNEIVLPIPVLVPFTTLDTNYGLAINLGNQATICSVGVVGNVIIEMISCTSKNTVFTCASVICFSFDELVRLLNEDERHATMEYKSYFRNTLVQIQDFDRYDDLKVVFRQRPEM